MRALWAWAVIVCLGGLLGLAGEVHDIVVKHKVPYVWGYVIGAWIWAPATLRASRRQGLHPLWFWGGAGTLGGLLLLIPIWEHGGEWKSWWRQVVAWVVFALLIGVIVVIGVTT